jgi:DNA-binding NarL/FixJ family response regulator
MPYSPGPTVLSKIQVLVLAPPGLLCAALMIFLRSLPRVQRVAEVHTPAELLELLNSNQPGQVLVLDADLLGAELNGVITRLKSTFPNIHQIVLASSPGQQQAALQAGAGRALLKGFLGDELHKALS